MPNDQENDPLLRTTLDKLKSGIVRQTGSFEITHITSDLKDIVNEQVANYLKSPEFTEIVSLELERSLDRKLDENADYSNAFYMGAGLSAFAGLVGYLYFGGYLGLLSVAAAAGPFIMSVLGLARVRK